MIALNFANSRRSALYRCAAALTIGWGAPAFACDVVTPTSVNVGSYSPAALKLAAPKNIRTLGGFSCSSANILTLLSGNFLKATVAAGTSLTLSSATTSDLVNYTLAADAAGTKPLVPGSETYYVNGVVLNLLNLGGNGAIDVPVHFSLSSAFPVAPGIYTGSFSITWDWYFCSGIGLLGLCIGAPDSGSKAVTVNITLTVAPKPVTLVVDPGTATWNPVEISNPKAIPGSKRRMMLTLANPDIVPIDSNTLSVVMPVPAQGVIALDGDGTGGAVVQTVDGSTTSTLTLSYVASTSTTDNVEFSTNGVTWTYAPVAGNAASQSAVTHVRFKPQGAMAPASSYAISIPYSLK